LAIRQLLSDNNSKTHYAPGSEIDRARSYRVTFRHGDDTTVWLRPRGDADFARPPKSLAMAPKHKLLARNNKTWMRVFGNTSLLPMRYVVESNA
jgi:hypothetical protein